MCVVCILLSVFDFTKKSNYFAYVTFLSDARCGKLRNLLSLKKSFRQINLRYFFLKLISRKNANIALFLSEIDFTKKKKMKKAKLHIRSKDALLSRK